MYGSGPSILDVFHETEVPVMHVPLVFDQKQLDIAFVVQRGARSRWRGLRHQWLSVVCQPSAASITTVVTPHPQSSPELQSAIHDFIQCTRDGMLTADGVAAAMSLMIMPRC